MLVLLVLELVVVVDVLHVSRKLVDISFFFQNDVSNDLTPG